MLIKDDIVCYVDAAYWKMQAAIGIMKATVSQKNTQERMGFKFMCGVGTEIWIACATKDMERGIVG